MNELERLKTEMAGLLGRDEGSGDVVKEDHVSGRLKKYRMTRKRRNRAARHARRITRNRG